MSDKKYNEGVIISLTLWINNHLDQRLTVDDIAEKAGYSKWYLQKLFARYQNETLARYIRKRKLAACVHDLKNSNAPIIGLAIKYHFESQQSFTRAFKHVMGCTPRVCRKRQLDAETQAQLADCPHPCALCMQATTARANPVCSGPTQRSTLCPVKYQSQQLIFLSRTLLSDNIAQPPESARDTWRCDAD
ncbi:MAG: helix-turn-helix domain-containing protein [Enterobacterales bacterium endosymbiont of Blomia tropicalis]|nr:helix-turn-helix domain-containing protein [Mixta mediterraneensis]MBE5253127.1 helix-turn-helix domain-containing protein [Mixta mediterraneensis]MDL4914278.1 helix-turn-helix domain-containing protein [Mixta mediterraneensis]